MYRTLQFLVKIILKAYLNPKIDRQLKRINLLGSIQSHIKEESIGSISIAQKCVLTSRKCAQISWL